MKLTPKERKARAKVSLREAEQKRNNEDELFSRMARISKATDQWPGTKFDDFFSAVREFNRLNKCLDEITKKTPIDTNSIRNTVDLMAAIRKKIAGELGNMFAPLIIHVVGTGDCKKFKTETTMFYHELKKWCSHDPAPSKWMSAVLCNCPRDKVYTVRELNMVLESRGYKKQDPTYLRRWARSNGYTVKGIRGRPHD